MKDVYCLQQPNSCDCTARLKVINTNNGCLLEYVVEFHNLQQQGIAMCLPRLDQVFLPVVLCSFVGVCNRREEEKHRHEGRRESCDMREEEKVCG